MALSPTKLSASAATFALSLASLLAVSLGLWLVYPRLTAVEHIAGGRSGPTTLPWTFGEAGKGHRLDVTLPVHWGTPRRWTIIPDDHFVALRVDGKAVPLGGVPAEALRDWHHGFTIDLGPWLHGGDNRLELTVDNEGGPGGLTLRPVPGWRNLLLVAGLLPWLLTLARVFRLRRAQALILGGALGVMCWYWSATLWFERSYDVKRYGEGGHIDYVIYLAEHASLPAPDQGWEYYQPPLYYGGGALAWRWARWLGISGPEALQAYSLMLWLVFLTASVAALNLTVRRSTWGVRLATAGLALWPSSILHAPRIGNDAALYAAAAVATWFMVRWWRGGRRRHLAGMALSIAAAFLCKSSAVVLLAAAGILMSLRMLRNARWRERRPWAESCVAAAVMSLGGALSVGRNVWYWKHGKLASWLVCNIGSLDKELRVPNLLRDYVPLDVPVFLANPWIDSRDDVTGRKNFWNYLIRSSLSGEFKFEGTMHEVIAIIWGVVVLWLVALLLLRLYARRPSLAALWGDAPWVLLGFFWVASIVSSRISYPYSCQADFRYMMPVLVPFILASVRGGWLPRVLLSVMAVGSLVFFVSV